MSRFTVALSRPRLWTLLAGLVLSAACGSGPTSPPPAPNPPPPPPPAPGVISIAPSAGSAVIEQAGQAAITVVVTRAGGFTGPVTITVEGLPAGVTATQSNVSTTGASTTATITFTVASSAVVGRTDLILRAAGTGVADASVLFTLTVTAAPAPGYELLVNGSPVTLPQGGSGQLTITIARSAGYAGNVALAVQGLPPGLTATITPTPTTGTTATLTLIASAGLAPATYDLNLVGAAAGLGNRTFPIQVSVTAVTGTGAVTLDFTQCGVYAIWVAYQDGAGPWTRVPPVGNRYQFTVSSPTAGYAFVAQPGGSGATIVNVQYMTRAEMSATPIVFCPPGAIGPKFINGAVVGFAPSQSALVTLGGGLIATPTAQFPTFVLGLVPNGDRDLVAWRWGGVPAPVDRIILRRDLNIPNGGTVGNLDFSASEAVAPVSATLTVTGLVAGEAQLDVMSFLTRASCDAAQLYQVGSGALATRDIFGVPASLRRPDDYHRLRIDAAMASGARFAEETFAALANRTVTLPGRLDPVAVTILSGSYKRLEATFSFPLEYNIEGRLSYISLTGTPRSVQLAATPAWVASTAAKLTTPDFSGVTGWSDIWAPSTAVATRWTVTASGRDAPATACREGSRVVGASAQGTN